MKREVVMHGIDGMGFGMGFGWIIGLIFLVAIVWFIVKTTNKNNKVNPSEKKSTLDILKERYARGEIGKEEFRERKNDLK